MKLLQIRLKLKKEYLIGILEDYDNSIKGKIAISLYGINNSEAITSLREKREFFKGQLTIIEQVLNTEI